MKPSYILASLLFTLTNAQANHPFEDMLEALDTFRSPKLDEIR
jgi:hypothetical protein